MWILDCEKWLTCQFVRTKPYLCLFIDIHGEQNNRRIKTRRSIS